MTVCTDLNNDDLELLWCKINPKHQASFLLCCFYCSPSISVVQSMDQFMANISVASALNMDITVIADLNINCDEHVFEGNAIYNLCNLYNMQPLINEPTRVTICSNSIIDVIITSMPNKHKNTTVVKTTLSDHYMILTDIISSFKQKSKKIKCRTFKDFNTDRFLYDVHELVESLDYDDNLETLWSHFKCILLIYVMNMLL